MDSGLSLEERRIKQERKIFLTEEVFRDIKVPEKSTEKSLEIFTEDEVEDLGEDQMGTFIQKFMVGTRIEPESTLPLVSVGLGKRYDPESPFDYYEGQQIWFCRVDYEGSDLVWKRGVLRPDTLEHLRLHPESNTLVHLIHRRTLHYFYSSDFVGIANWDFSVIQPATHLWAAIWALRKEMGLPIEIVRYIIENYDRPRGAYASHIEDIEDNKTILHTTLPGCLTRIDYIQGPPGEFYECNPDGIFLGNNDLNQTMI